MLPQGRRARDAGADKEPLRSDLDVKGIKAQVLGRTEVVEAREREREELVAELVPAMESRGYETVGRRQ